MQIKKRLQLNTLATILAGLSIVIVLIFGFEHVNRAMKASGIADQILTTSFETTTLRTDYLMTGADSSKDRWFAKHQEIDKLLQQAPALFKDPADRRTIEGMVQDHNFAGTLFSTIVGNREREKTNPAYVPLLRNTEKRLISELNVRLSQKIAGARRLHESATAHLFTTVALVGSGVIYLIAFVSAAALLNSWSLTRIITSRITKLRDGAAVIGEGNLDHRIDIQGADEFAALSASFNAMTDKLSRVYKDLTGEIAARRFAEDALKQSEAFLNAIIENAPVCIKVVAQNGTLLKMNSAGLSMIGANSFEQVRGKSVYPLVAARDRKAFMKLTAEVFENKPGTLEFEALTLDGRHIWLSTRAVPLYDNSGNITALLGITDDVTDRKKAEEALRRSYNLTKTIIDSMQDSISLLDVKTFRIVDANSVFLRQYGYSAPEEVAGKHCYEITHQRADICSPPDDVCPLAETVRTGKHFSVDHVHTGKQGEKIFVEVSTSPIKDENGAVVQVVHVQRDISERKRAEAERERLIEELKRSNRELEQFAYVASHDLQEPLRMVGSYTTLLEKRYQGQLDARAHEYIRFAVDGAERMQKLIEGLLAFSRISRRGAQFKPVDLNAIFTLAISNLSVTIKENGAAVTRDDLPMVTGDETQLVQLFQNLIGNGVKYKRDGVGPRVHVSARNEGKNYVISVTDNGIGIESQYYDKIFQIFQRLHTRAEYSGTGIGLSLCKRIVERHSGRIWVESVPGQSSTFFFTIPVGAEEAKPVHPPLAQKSVSSL